MEGGVNCKCLVIVSQDVPRRQSVAEGGGGGEKGRARQGGSGRNRDEETRKTEIEEGAKDEKSRI